MEEKQKIIPQKILDFPSIEEPITLLEDKTVVINKLRFRSGTVHDFLMKEGNRPDACIQAIRIGAIALGRTQASGETDYINKKLNESFQSLEGSIRAAFDPLSPGSLASRINKVFEVQNQSVKEVLSSDLKSKEDFQTKLMTFTAELKERLYSAFEKQISEGGLGIVLGQLRSGIADLRDTVVAGGAVAESSAPIIGKNFEEKCQLVLENFCQAHGCILDDLRSVQGICGSKKGDFKISKHDLEGIVLEMKSKSTPMTLPACLAEIDLASKNRSCGIGILVGDQEALPADAGIFNEYGADGNQILCGFEVLEIGLKIAMAKARIQKAQTTDIQNLDVQLLLAQINKLEVSLRKFSRLRSNCSALKKSADKVDQLAGEMHSEMGAVVDEMTQTISNGSETPAEK